MNYVVTTLGEIARWGSGGTPKRDRPEFFDGDIPWAVIGDLGDGIVSQTSSSISEKGLASSSAKWIEPGSVLIAMYGSIGKLGIAGKRMTSNQAIAFAHPHDDVDAKFLFWYLRSMRTQLQSLGRGGTQRNIGQGTIKSLPFMKPPLEYQKIVVDEIEKQLTRLEAAKGSVSHGRNNLKLYRRAVLQAAVAGRLTRAPEESAPRLEEILKLREEDGAISGVRTKHKPPTSPVGGLDVPSTWTVTALEQATSALRPICYGILKPRVAEPGAVPYVEVRDLRGGRIREQLNRTSPALDEEFRRSRLEPGDVVIAIRGSYDRSAVVPESLVGANISRDVARIAPLRILHPSFLSLYLQSPVAHRYFSSIARGSAVKGLNIGDLRAMPVPIPSFSEQLDIVDEAERLLSLADDLLTQLERTEQRAKNLQQSILLSAFSDRLVGMSVR